MLAHPTRLALALAPLVLVGCSDETPPVDEAPAATAELPAPRRVEVPEPSLDLKGATRNEALAEVLTDWMIAFGEKLQIRDFDGLEPWFTEGFEGEDPWSADESASVARAEELPLGVRRHEAGDVPGEIYDRAAFIDRVEHHVGDWRRVTQVNFKLLGVEFQDPGGLDEVVEWGRAKVKLHVVGETADGGFDSLTAKGYARVVNDGGTWRLDRLVVHSRVRLVQDAPTYSEVSRAAGVAFDGPAFGAEGNESVAWGGVASADVDGDGLFDLFVPSSTQSFLYLNRGDGGFDEASSERGLGAEAAGTGAVFFDYDRDGDADLVVAHVGWTRITGETGGTPLRLYANDGSGNFEDATESSGLGQHHASYGVTVFDADGDGWMDLFVCGYGRMEYERNDSWIRATNGEPDLFLRNAGGRFVDATREAGFRDKAWGYSAAAADFDEDGDQDLFVANNFGPCSLWRNEGGGRFVDVARELGVESAGNVMGASWGDLDADGVLDLYLASPSSVAGSRMLTHLDLDGRDRAARNLRQLALGNRLFHGDGEGGFDEVPLGHGASSAGWSWSAHITDLDLDGGLDVACVNGFVTGELTGDT